MLSLSSHVSIRDGRKERGGVRKQNGLSPAILFFKKFFQKCHPVSSTCISWPREVARNAGKFSSGFIIFLNYFFKKLGILPPTNSGISSGKKEDCICSPSSSCPAPSNYDTMIFGLVSGRSYSLPGVTFLLSVHISVFEKFLIVRIRWASSG